MKKLNIGVDLQSEYTEYAIYDSDRRDAICYSLDGSDVAVRVPNSIFVTADDKLYAGLKAAECNVTMPGDYYDNIVEKLDDTSIVIVDGKEYDYTELFCIMLKLQLEDVIKDADAEINKLIIASPLADQTMSIALNKLAKMLHIDRDKVEMVSSQIAMLFYVFKQDSGVWKDGVGLFHYESEHIRYEHVAVDRYLRPMRINITNTLYPFGGTSDEGGLYMARPPITEGQEDKQDATFLRIAENALRKYNQRLSGIFLMGDGFKTDWLNQSADFLCKGRRVFVGQNIYAKGACYAAESGSAAMGNNIFLESDTMVHYDIGVRVRYNGKEQIAPIVLGEQEWFNAYGTVDVILDDTKKIEIDLYDNNKGELIQEFIEIKGLPNRPPKTTKLSISVRYIDAKCGEICIKDKGFGSMYPTTGKVYRKEFKLES